MYEFPRYKNCYNPKYLLCLTNHNGLEKRKRIHMIMFTAQILDYQQTSNSFRILGALEHKKSKYCKESPSANSKIKMNENYKKENWRDKVFRRLI